MHVLIGLRAGVWCGSAHSGAPWTPPTARGMLKRRQAALLARAPCWRLPVRCGAGEETKGQLLLARLLCYVPMTVDETRRLGGSSAVDVIR